MNNITFSGIDLFLISAYFLTVLLLGFRAGRKKPKEAEAFLAQDLSDLDFSQFKIARFEFEKKSAQINMRVPQPLLEAVKARAKARGIPYTRFIRETLEQVLMTKES